MTQTETSFTTSFGKTIEFVAGHNEFVKDTVGLLEQVSADFQYASLNNNAGGYQELDLSKVEHLEERWRSVSLHAYGVRLHRTYQFLDLLRNTHLESRFKKSLDIGCGNAIQPRILKGLGIVDEAVGIDVFDRSSGINERELSRRHRQFRRLRMIDPILQRIEAVPPNSRSYVQQAMQSNLPNPRAQFKRNVGWLPDVEVYRLRFKRKPTLDRYITGDVFDLDEKFDLITSFYSLEWFEVRSLFRKISSLLEPGGVFFALTTNWWRPFNSTTLAGLFPYACQRLTKQDYFRYIDEFFPDNAEGMKIAYGYFDPGHPTLSDYIEIGHENGLIGLDRRSIPVPGDLANNQGITPLGYLRLDPTILMSVLDDVHEFRPDVRLDDLLTHSSAIIFQKIDQARGQRRIDPKELLPQRPGGKPNPILRFLLRYVGRLAHRLMPGVLGRSRSGR